MGKVLHHQQNNNDDKKAQGKRQAAVNCGWLAVFLRLLLPSRHELV